MISPTQPPPVRTDGASRDSQLVVRLVEGAANGDERSWELLVRYFRPRVLKWCRSNLVRSTDVEDVCQEVLLRLSQRIARFHRRRADDTFSGWLFVMTKRLCLDFLRKETRFRRLTAQQTQSPDQEPLDLTCDPQEMLAEEELSAERLRQVRSLVRREFNETYGRLFEAIALEQRTPQDVAADMGLSLNAVYLAKSRMYRRLKILVRC